ncbi:hypothetical protein JCM5296_006524 [Sporobolomyces johnsonii]
MAGHVDAAPGRRTAAGAILTGGYHPSKLWVGGLPDTATLADLEDCFGQIGPCSCNIKRGFGFVEYTDPAHATEAVAKYNEGHFLGAQIKVELSLARAAAPKQEEAKVPQKNPPGSDRPSDSRKPMWINGAPDEKRLSSNHGRGRSGPPGPGFGARFNGPPPGPGYGPPGPGYGPPGPGYGPPPPGYGPPPRFEDRPPFDRPGPGFGGPPIPPRDFDRYGPPPPRDFRGPPPGYGGPPDPYFDRAGPRDPNFPPYPPPAAAGFPPPAPFDRPPYPGPAPLPPTAARDPYADRYPPATRSPVVAPYEAPRGGAPGGPPPPLDAARPAYPPSDAYARSAPPPLDGPSGAYDPREERGARYQPYPSREERGRPDGPYGGRSPRGGMERRRSLSPRRGGDPYRDYPPPPPNGYYGAPSSGYGDRPRSPPRYPPVDEYNPRR